jgi:hypothetical protein
MDMVALTAILATALPSLMKVGENLGTTLTQKAAELGNLKLGEEAWAKAKRIWDILQPKLAERASAEEAAKDVAQNPEDPDLQTVLRVQLKKLLDQDPDLAQAIAAVLQEKTESSATVQIQQTITNNDGQVIGQMTGGVAIGRVDGNIHGNITP